MLTRKAEKGICGEYIPRSCLWNDWFEAGFHLTFTGLTPKIHLDTCKQGPQKCLSTWMNYKMLVACV